MLDFLGNKVRYAFYFQRAYGTAKRRRLQQELLWSIKDNYITEYIIICKWDFVVWDRNREQSKMIASHVQGRGHDEVRVQPGF